MSEASPLLDLSSMTNVAIELRAMARRIGAPRKYDTLDRIQDALMLVEIADAIDEQAELLRPRTAREMEAADRSVARAHGDLGWAAAVMAMCFIGVCALAVLR